jgi:P27 family predicted phage terminase small subunit
MSQGQGGGPKPKPTHLKLITGQTRAGRINRAEPQPRPALPRPPAELSEDALIEWKRVSRQLIAVGILTTIDRGTLAAYCQAHGRWLQAERALADMAKRDQLTSGLMIKTHHGNVIQNPLVGTANKSMNDMVRFAAELGMTPSARSRVKTSYDQQGDKADDFFSA